jgi:hypothetical protein
VPHLRVDTGKLRPHQLNVDEFNLVARIAATLPT